MIPLPFTTTFDLSKYNSKGTEYFQELIEHTVVQKSGKITGSTQQHSGVYMVPLKSTSTGNTVPYFGRTNRTLKERISEHRKSIDKRDRRCAMIIHKQDNPGHDYDLNAARIV